jgi:hypothetical protein
MSSESEKQGLIDRREAIRRVTTILGGVALVGGSSLLAACEKERAAPAAKAADGRIGDFTRADVAFLDEVAETILPETKTPGAKAAQVGAFMALMVTDTYDAREQRAFRAGMGALDAASQKAHGATFTAATAPQRLALLQTLDREQKAEADAREAAAERAPKGSRPRSRPRRPTPPRPTPGSPTSGRRTRPTPRSAAPPR